MLPKETFDLVVRHTPLVSFDLLVRDGQGRLLLGRRANRPAQNTWFVPGGCIEKDERLAAAFRRITRMELGVEIDLSTTRFVGYFEHLYPDNRSGLPGFGTHYIVLAHEISGRSFESNPAHHSWFPHSGKSSGRFAGVCFALAVNTRQNLPSAPGRPVVECGAMP